MGPAVRVFFGRWAVALVSGAAIAERPKFPCCVGGRSAEAPANNVEAPEDFADPGTPATAAP